MYRLNQSHYPDAEKRLNEIPANTLFARTVLRGMASGEVFGDHPESPQAFYVKHNYCMSLVFGKPDSSAFVNWLVQRFTSGQNQAQEWLQACPNHWQATLKEALAPFIISASEFDSEQLAQNMVAARSPQIYLAKRLNFQFDYSQFSPPIKPPQARLIETTAAIFNQQKGSVLVREFWPNHAEFEQHGYGISAMVNDEEVCTAFSSFLLEGKLELGIETRADMRGRGLAFASCAQLIKYCLSHNLEPVWSCRDGNLGSKRLAEKLGFRQSLELDYFGIPVVTA